MTAARRNNIMNVVDGLKPTLLMVAVSIAFAGANVLYVLAELDGMSTEMINAYRFIFASAFIVPLALVHDRSFPLL